MRAATTPSSIPTAISFDAAGEDQTTPVRLYLYIFRNRASFERLRTTVDDCARSYVTDPETFESIDQSPYVLTGQGPWAPGFEADASCRSRGRRRQRRLRVETGRSGAVRGVSGVVRHGPLVRGRMGRPGDGVGVRPRATLRIWSPPARHPVASFPRPCSRCSLAVGTVAGAVARDGTTPTPSSGSPDGPGRRSRSRRGRGRVEVGRPGAGRPAMTRESRQLVRPWARRMQPPTREPRRPSARRPRRPRLPPASRAATTCGCPRSASTGRSTGYACSNKSYPGDRVYRWGCAGRQQRVPLRSRPQRVQAAPRRVRPRPAARRAWSSTTPTATARSIATRSPWWKVTTPTKGTWAYAAPVDARA